MRLEVITLCAVALSLAVNCDCRPVKTYSQDVDPEPEPEPFMPPSFVDQGTNYEARAKRSVPDYDEGDEAETESQGRFFFNKLHNHRRRTYNRQVGGYSVPIYTKRDYSPSYGGNHGYQGGYGGYNTGYYGGSHGTQYSLHNSASGHNTPGSNFAQNTHHVQSSSPYDSSYNYNHNVNYQSYPQYRKAKSASQILADGNLRRRRRSLARKARSATPYLYSVPTENYESIIESYNFTVAEMVQKISEQEDPSKAIKYGEFYGTLSDDRSTLMLNAEGISCDGQFLLLCILSIIIMKLYFYNFCNSLHPSLLVFTGS